MTSEIGHRDYTLSDLGDKTSVTRSNHPSMGSFTVNPRSIIDVCLVQEGKLFLKLRYPVSIIVLLL